jgi:hypothetical protein
MSEKPNGDLKRGVDQHILIKSWNIDAENNSLEIEITDKSFKDDKKRSAENRIFDAAGKTGFWLNEGTTVKLFNKGKTIEKKISEKIKCDYVGGKPDDEKIVQIKFIIDI